MDEPAQVTVEFEGDRCGRAPLTWGQRAIWKAVENVAPNDHWLNVRRVIVIPERRAVPLGDVLSAVGRLVSGHEALRTLIRSVGDDQMQVVARSGSLAVTVVEVDVEADAAAPPRQLTEINDSVCAPPVLAEATDELLRQLADVPFRYAEQWPLRVGAVVDGPTATVRHIVLVMSHVAVDWHAAELVVRDLRLLMSRGTTAQREGLRALDLALRERASTRRTARAVEHWLRALGRIQTEPFALRSPPQRPRYHQACLTSRALRSATTLLAARHGMSTSTVLLAASAAVISSYTGHRTCGLLTIVSNRFQPGHKNIVAPMNQLALVALDVGEADPADPGSLHALIPAAWQAALLAYQHVYYDQAVLDRVLVEAGYSTGNDVAPHCCFNDVRTTGDQTAPVRGLRAEPVSAADGDHLRAQLRDTTVRWRSMDSFNWRFYLEIRSAPDALALVLTADSMALPPDRLEGFLRQLEGFVVEAAVTGGSEVRNEVHSEFRSERVSRP